MLRKTIRAGGGVLAVVVLISAVLFTFASEKSPLYTPSWLDFLYVIARDMFEQREEVSTEEVKEVYHTHLGLMQAMVETCIEYPEIRRVGIEQGEVSYYLNAPPSDVDDLNAAVASMRQSLATITASSAHCGRRGDHEGNPLSDVLFGMYPSGIPLSSELKSIGYTTDWGRQNSALSEEELRGRGYTPLDKPGWYIYESDN